MKIYTIYKATNIINNKTYVGFDSNWPSRKNKHKNYHLKKITKFYSAIKKYGWDSFEWTVLYQSKDKNHTLNEMENFFIEEYDSINSGYNLIPGGSNRKNCRQSEETKNKISKKFKGRIFTEKHRQNMRGKIRTEEHRKNLSLSQKGKPKPKSSVEKRKITIENKGSYNLTEEHKQKISNALKGKSKPEYHKGRSKIVIINGIQYNSQKEAKETLNISFRQLYKILKNQSLTKL
jgi:group I intron endonuclease